MKLNTRITGTALLLVFLVGCASPEFRIKPLPDMKGGSPLRGTSPLSFTIHEFQSPANHQSPHYKLVGSVGEVVAQGIDGELRRTGHDVLTGKDSGNARISIAGSVNELTSKMHEGWWAFRFEVYAEMDVIVTVPSDPAKTLRRSFSGSSNHKAWSWKILRSRTEEYVNEALSQMVKSFTTDPEFIEFLNTVH